MLARVSRQREITVAERDSSPQELGTVDPDALHTPLLVQVKHRDYEWVPVRELCPL